MWAQGLLSLWIGCIHWQLTAVLWFPKAQYRVDVSTRLKAISVALSRFFYFLNSSSGNRKNDYRALYVPILKASKG